MAAPPLKLKPALALSFAGVPPARLSFGNASQSDRLVIVRDSAAAVVDTSAPTLLMRYPPAAEATLLHPARALLALVGVNLHLFHNSRNLQRSRTTVPEPVTFWKLVTPDTIAIATAEGVYDRIASKLSTRPQAPLCHPPLSATPGVEREMVVS
jgi:hypothetical protein